MTLTALSGLETVDPLGCSRASSGTGPEDIISTTTPRWIARIPDMYRAASALR